MEPNECPMNMDISQTSSLADSVKPPVYSNSKI